MADEGRFDADARKNVEAYGDGGALPDQEDTWGKLVAHLTGYPMPPRSTLFETLTSDHGGPLFRMDIKNRSLEEVMGKSGLMMSDGQDYDIWFFDGNGSTAQLKQARIVFEGVVHGDDGMSFDDTEGKNPNDIALGSGNEFEDYNKQKMSLAALDQYMGGPRDAVQALLRGSTEGFSHNGLRVPKAAEINLASFNSAADSFDRAAKFFRDHAEVIKNWEDALGKENASWKGESAEVFRNLLSKVRENYEGYVDTFTDGSSGEGSRTVYAEALLEGRRRVEEAGHALLNAWFKWVQSEYYDPHRVLRYVLDEVARWSEENNISKTEIYTTTYGGYYTTAPVTSAKAGEGFSQTHPKFGDLADKESWKKIGEEAVRIWNRGVDELLVPEAERVQSLLNNQFIDLGQEFTDNQPKPRTTSTASADYADDQEAKEKAEAEREKDEAKAEADRQKAEYEKDRDEAKAEADREKAEYQKEKDEAEAEAEREKAEAERKAEEERQKIEESLGGLNGGGPNGLGGNGPSTTDLGNLTGLNGDGTPGEGSGEGLGSGGLGGGGLGSGGLGSGGLGSGGLGRGGLGNGPSTTGLGNLTGLNGDGVETTGSPLPGGVGGPVGLGGGPSRDNSQARGPVTTDLGSLTGLNDDLTSGNSGGLENPGGGTTALNSDGTLSTDFPGGSTSSFDPETGTLTTTAPDGTVTTDDLETGRPVTNPDGSTTTLENGRLHTEFPDGTRHDINPETGAVTTTDPNGNVTETTLASPNRNALNESALNHSGLGSGLGSEPGTPTTQDLGNLTGLNDDLTSGNSGGLENPGGSTQTPTTQNLGNLTGLNDDLTSGNSGGLENPGGGTTALNSDGTLSTDFPGGSTSSFDPETGTLTTTAPDGTVTTDDLETGRPVTNPDGSTTTLENGRLHTEFPDGTRHDINPETGAVTTTDPNGNVTETTLASPNRNALNESALNHSGLGSGLGSGGSLSGSGSELGPGSGAGTSASGLPSLSGGGASSLGSPEAAVPDSGVPAEKAEDGEYNGQGAVGASGSGTGGMPMGGMPMGGMGGMGGGGDQSSHGERVRAVLTDANDRAKRKNGGRRGSSRHSDDAFLAPGRTATSGSGVPGDGRGGGPFSGAPTTSGAADLLEEDEDVWGTDEGGAPAVIGR